MVNENNKYIPKTPETYEVRYVEQVPQSNLAKIANYLGFSQVECSSDSSSSNKEVAKAQNTFVSMSSYSPSERKEVSNTLSDTTKHGSKQEYRKTAGNEKTGDYASESISYDRK